MIKAPVSELVGADRQMECHRALDGALMACVNQAVDVGWTTAEVFNALQAIIIDRRPSATEGAGTAGSHGGTSLDAEIDGATANL